MNDNKISPLGEPVTVEPQARRGTNPPHRILIVDDDGDIRRLNTEVLIQSGYRVDAAKDGAAAWVALQISNYDLLITDNKMPRVSGVELIKKVHAARMALPVIMASGTIPKEEFTRYPWLQPTALLPKPFTGDELLGAVKKVLRVTDSASEQRDPLPSWQSQTPDEGLCL